jgi:NAD(P)-dependent dehydrogenase (short-subunit alcohol dehydrogenase family)
MKLLEDRAALVTGASRGLGLAVATALAVDGARVLLVARSEERLARAAASVREHGGLAFTAAADLSLPGAHAPLVETTLRELGGLDILVNCAGVFVWKTFLDLTEEDWRRTIETNLTATFLLSQAAARAMVEQGRGGAIINIASIHGLVGDPNVAAHCASKFGVVGLTRAMAESLREHDIRVNAVAPGSLAPDSAGRRGASPREKITHADVASLVVYLASDLSRSITGATVEAYGSTHTVIKA